MVWLSYIISSIRQHKWLSILMFFILFINGYVLTAFFGEFARTGVLNWGVIELRDETGLPFLLQEKEFEEIKKLYKKYGKGFSGIQKINVEIAGGEEEFAIKDVEKMKFMVASYNIKTQEDDNFTEDELKEGVPVVKTKWAETGEEYTAFGNTFYAYNYDSKMDCVPIQEVIDLEMPIYYILFFCDGGSVNEVDFFAKKLKNIYPDAIIRGKYADENTMKEKRKIILFIIMAIIAVANIVFIYEYILESKKREIQIYRITGCSGKRMAGILFTEIQFYYMAGFACAFLLYYISYPLLYKWGFASFKARMELAYIIQAFIIMDIVIMAVFGIFILRLFRNKPGMVNI